ncbi:MAG: NAD-dependent epimerase/dehydratase family protein [Clostridium sp.]
MKILITGAGGWLGSELTEQLLEQGKHIKALVLITSQKLEELKNKYKDRLEIIEGDICSEQTIEEVLIDVSKVFHLAAKVHCQPKNEKDIQDFFKINTEASKLIFDKCLEKNIERVIFYSSVSVYGESEEMISVNSPKNPVTPYAKSKLQAEEYGMKLFEEKGLKLTVIQPVTVYGGDDVGNFEKMRAFSEKGFLPRFGDGKNKKTIIYFKDLIEMTVKISEKEDFIGKTVICGTETISINRIIEILTKIDERKCRIIKINKVIANLLEKIFEVKLMGKMNVIGRQIRVLKMNNKYNIQEVQEMIGKSKSFEEYYGRGKK